jgi:hypothetical protein
VVETTIVGKDDATTQMQDLKSQVEILQVDKTYLLQERESKQKSIDRLQKDVDLLQGLHLLDTPIPYLSFLFRPIDKHKSHKDICCSHTVLKRRSNSTQESKG